MSWIKDQGFRDVKEALAYVIAKKPQKKEETEVERQRRLAREMGVILSEIEAVIGDFDIDNMRPKDRKYLKDLPLNTIEQAHFWKQEWLRAMEIYQKGL